MTTVAEVFTSFYIQCIRFFDILHLFHTNGLMCQFSAAPAYSSGFFQVVTF